jgi:hypothetical protein
LRIVIIEVVGGCAQDDRAGHSGRRATGLPPVAPRQGAAIGQHGAPGHILSRGRGALRKVRPLQTEQGRIARVPLVARETSRAR